MSKAQTAAVAVSLAPAIALDLNSLIFTVVLPIIAAWSGLVSLAMFDGKTAKEILHQMLASILMGGVIAIISLVVINLMKLTGSTAACATLSIAMAPHLIGKHIAKLGPNFMDVALGTLGLQRKAPSQDTPPDAIPPETTIENGG